MKSATTKSGEKKGRRKALTAEQRAQRDRAIYEVRLSQWERLLRAIELAELEAETLAECLMDAFDSDELYHHLGCARAMLLGNRPQLVRF